MSKFYRLLRKYNRDGFFSAAEAICRHTKRSILQDRWFQYMTAIRYKRQKFKYQSPANPYKTIHIKLDRLREFNKAIPTHRGLGIVKSGDWDIQSNCIPIKSTTHYKGFKQRFEEGYDWEDTVYYEKRKRKFSHRDSDRLDYIDELYERIKSNGYRPNYEANHDAPGKERQGRQRHIHALEPLVAIGRDGEIYLSEGFHRVSLAKILDIQSIPVNVLVRHEQWQQIRDRVLNSSKKNVDPSTEEYSSHPDIHMIKY